jgi:hypothetical protein
MNTKLEHRTIMKFLWSEVIDPIKTYSRLLRAFQEDVYTLLSVYEEIRAFKTGYTNLLDKYLAEWSRFDHIDFKFCHYSTKTNFIMLELLHKSWEFVRVQFMTGWSTRLGSHCDIRNEYSICWLRMSRPRESQLQPKCCGFFRSKNRQTLQELSQWMSSGSF